MSVTDMAYEWHRAIGYLEAAVVHVGVAPRRRQVLVSAHHLVAPYPMSLPDMA